MLCFNTCFCQVKNFTDILMLQTGRYAPFVELRIKSTEYEGLVIIKTSDIYTFLEFHLKNTNKSYLRKYLSNELQTRSYLDVGNISIDKWGFRKVLPNESVKYHALKGKDVFIKYYFHEGRNIVVDIKSEEESAVISQLLKWGTATVIGHEIPKLQLANVFYLQYVFMIRHPQQFKNIIVNFIVHQNVAPQ